MYRTFNSAPIKPMQATSFNIRFMKIWFFVILRCFCYIILFTNCASNRRLPQVDNKLNYTEFDFMSLQGKGMVQSNDSHSKVVVGYKNNNRVPSFFMFKERKGNVLFQLKDSLFSPENHIVYVYYCKNFFGGKPGIKKYYRGYKYKNEYLIYIDTTSKSVICQIVSIFPKISSALSCGAIITWSSFLSWKA